MTYITNTCPCGEPIKENEKMCQSCATKIAVMMFAEHAESWKEDKRDGGGYL